MKRKPDNYYFKVIAKRGTLVYTRYISSKTDNEPVVISQAVEKFPELIGMILDRLERINLNEYLDGKNRN